MDQAKTYETVQAIDEGGSYEVRDGRIARVVEPTAPRAVEPAEAGPGAAVGAASGEPPARVEGKATKPSKPASDQEA